MKDRSMLDVFTVLNILQSLLAASTSNPILPWSIYTHIEAGIDTWGVRIRINKDTNPIDTFIHWYWTITEAVAQAPYPGLILIEPRLTIILPVNSIGVGDSKRNHFLSFELRVVEGLRPTIWNNLNPLEVENPLTLREGVTKVKLVHRCIVEHALFGFEPSSTLRVRNIEVPLIDCARRFKIVTTRPHDPFCKLPLPRFLEDYDLSSNIRAVSYHRLDFKYHASIVDLSCAWEFTFEVLVGSRV